MPSVDWPHAPRHELSVGGTFMVTVGTYGKRHFFRGAQRLGVLHRGLLRVAAEAGWRLEAWAVFSNHYHFVGHSPEGDAGAGSLAGMLARLHARTAIWINKLDGSEGRQVWHNFWETRLAEQRSFLARLNYVHQNAVSHGLVERASLYPYCSAGWFERVAGAAMVKCVYRFKTDRLRVLDEYEVEGSWRE